jgi:hypothetical protein
MYNTKGKGKGHMEYINIDTIRKRLQVREIIEWFNQRSYYF